MKERMTVGDWTMMLECRELGFVDFEDIPVEVTLLMTRLEHIQ